jgi:hypothetical protein
MSTIADSDYFIINRGDKSYKISAEDVKSELGGGSYDGEGRFDTPVQVITPPSGAGLSDSSTYEPFTPPSIRDMTPEVPRQFFMQFDNYSDITKIDAPAIQVGPDGELFRPELGEVLSVTKTDYSANVKVTGNLTGSIADGFNGSDGKDFGLSGVGAVIDFTDCNLPVYYAEMRVYCRFFGEGATSYIEWTDGTVTASAFDAADFKNFPPRNAAIKRIYAIGGTSSTKFEFAGIRIDDGDYNTGITGSGWVRNNMWQLNFAEPTNNLRYMVYGMTVGPHNEMVCTAGWKMNSLVLHTLDAGSPTATKFVAGDICIAPEITARAGIVGKESSSPRLELTSTTGYWFPGLCVKGSPITASAPSAQSVEFTSANFNTTPVTGTNVSLTNRRWSLESSPNEGGPWTVVGSYDDDSANFTQNGANKWEGKPTLQNNTYYRVKVRYDSANAPSEESTLNYFKTA